MEECILFVGCLYYLSLHCHSCCFYTKYHGGIREITSMPVYIYIHVTRWRNIRLFYNTFVLAMQKRSRFEPGYPVHYLWLRPWYSLGTTKLSKLLFCWLLLLLTKVVSGRSSVKKAFLVVYWAVKLTCSYIG